VAAPSANHSQMACLGKWPQILPGSGFMHTRVTAKHTVITKNLISLAQTSLLLSIHKIRQTTLLGRPTGVW